MSENTRSVTYFADPFPSASATTYKSTAKNYYLVVQ